MENREAINIITAKMDVHQAVFGHPVDEPLKTAYDLAISALEKQTPRTVRTQFDRWHNYFLHFCPVCGGLVREYEYCNECGQKLSYEEEQEEDE